MPIADGTEGLFNSACRGYSHLRVSPSCECVVNVDAAYQCNVEDEIACLAMWCSACDITSTLRWTV